MPIRVTGNGRVIGAWNASVKRYGRHVLIAIGDLDKSTGAAEWSAQVEVCSEDVPCLREWLTAWLRDEMVEE